MDTLIKFVDAWEKTGNIEEILSQNIVLPPSDNVQAYLSTLSQAEQTRIRKALSEATVALTSHSSRMEEEAGLLKSQIDQNIQSSNACLAYNKIPKK